MTFTDEINAYVLNNPVFIGLMNLIIAIMLAMPLTFVLSFVL